MHNLQLECIEYSAGCYDYPSTEFTIIVICGDCNMLLFVRWHTSLDVMLCFEYAVGRCVYIARDDRTPTGVLLN